MIDTGLADKVVLVTGANSPAGIGAATARAFAGQGARVFLHAYRRDDLGDSGELADVSGEERYADLQRTPVRDIVDAIRASGGVADSWESDLGEADAARALLDRAETAFGPVDVLVNNAAHCEPDTLGPTESLAPGARAVDGFPMRALSAASFDRHLAVNARAPALLMAELARRVFGRANRWGRIVNVSTDGARGFPTEVSYGASKLALESLSRAAAIELGPLRILVNVVSLGPIQTGWISPELADQIAAETPLRRVGQPEDVADVIVFLASEQARWITGQVVHVGGGHTI